MPRQSRIYTTGALRHIIARGIERRMSFDDDHDRHDFIKNLGLVLEQKREGLAGGGLKRSVGGWAAVKQLRECQVHGP
ncbi:MAG: hypothetical protein ABIJ50_02695 [Pseudomonadota bacterium]